MIKDCVYPNYHELSTHLPFCSSVIETLVSSKASSQAASLTSHCLPVVFSSLTCETFYPQGHLRAGLGLGKVFSGPLAKAGYTLKKCHLYLGFRK